MHAWHGQGKPYLYIFSIQLGFGFLLQAPLFCVILGFLRGVDEICTLLGFNAALTFKMGSVVRAETSI
jgi:hypothetical protein